MWVNLHISWHDINKITNKQVWQSLIFLFFSSFFPYATSIVSTHFNHPIAQAFYGIIVLLVSFANVWMYNDLAKISTSAHAKQFAIRHNRSMIYDVAIKLIGLIIAITIYPSAMMYSVVLAAIFIVKSAIQVTKSVY